MVADEDYAAVLAENARLRQQVADLQPQLPAALVCIQHLEALKRRPRPAS